METIDNTMSTVFNNKYASALIVMFLIAYSGLAAPKLPSFIAKLFDNAIFRILILSLIVYNGNRDPKIAIMVAVGFTITMNILSKQKLFEGFSENEPNTDSNDDETTDENTHSDETSDDNEHSDENVTEGFNNDPSDPAQSQSEPSQTQTEPSQTQSEPSVPEDPATSNQSSSEPTNP